jgi:predicted amidohydrolase
MNVALLQLKVELASATKNRAKVADFVSKAAVFNPDVIVLPETWNLGFFPQENLFDLAETNGGESKSLLAELAAKYKINIVGGSIITKKGGNVYNTSYIFDRHGNQIAEYDKIHSFSPSGEHLHFKHGQKLCLFELDGMPAAVIICYDLRFTELVRILALKGIQTLFVPAQWPHPRLEHWQILNRARAIENQIYVACVNGVGSANGLNFCGHSMLIGPFGEILAGTLETETIICGEIDCAVIHNIREKINVFRDRKPQIYSCN